MPQRSATSLKTTTFLPRPEEIKNRPRCSRAAGFLVVYGKIGNMKWFNVPTSRRGLGLKFRKEQRVEDQIALIENHLKTLNGQAEVIFGAKGSALGDLELAQSYEGSVADVCYAAGTTVDHAGGASGEVIGRFGLKIA